MRQDRNRATLLAALAAAALPLAAGAAEPPRAGTIRLVSVGMGGALANGDSFNPSISGDGRTVAFASGATNLVKGDTNGHADIFVRDLPNGSTVRISVGPGGRQASGDSYRPAISADGKVVAFFSEAGDLVPGDRNGALDLFVHDRATGRLERITSPGGADLDGPIFEGLSFSGFTRGVSLSGDGRHVAFTSSATNLVPGTRPRHRARVFVRDRATGATELVAVGPGGVEADRRAGLGGISPDREGRYVTFATTATNLGDASGGFNLYRRDRRTGETTRVVGFGVPISPGPVSADGRVTIFKTDYRLYASDLAAGTFAPVALGPGGVQANANRTPSAALSADGRVVGFVSAASNLAPPDDRNSYDAFVRDLAEGSSERVAVRLDGGRAKAGSADPSLSADGGVVAFASAAHRLVPRRTTGEFLNVYVRTR